MKKEWKKPEVVELEVALTEIFAMCPSGFTRRRRRQIT